MATAVKMTYLYPGMREYIICSNSYTVHMSVTIYPETIQNKLNISKLLFMFSNTDYTNKSPCIEFLC